MARTSRRHSYRKSRRWNPGLTPADKMVLSELRKKVHAASHGAVADVEIALDEGMLSPDIASKARRWLSGLKKAKSSRKGRSSKRRSTKSRRSTKRTSRKSTRRSTKSRKGKSRKSSRRSITSRSRQERKARRKARYYQTKHKMKAKRGGNSKRALNRALYYARGGRFASKNPRRRSARRSYRRW